MFNPKIRFTYDEKRLIIYALIDLKNRLLEEGRYQQLVIRQRHQRTESVHGVDPIHRR